jgi:hypothetical protein
LDEPMLSGQNDAYDFNDQVNKNPDKSSHKKRESNKLQINTIDTRD